MANIEKWDPTANAFDNEPLLRSQRSERNRPSKGCESCRRRKVKCDANRPTCSRCHDRGLNCKYRDYTLQIFRDETGRAASRVQERMLAKQHERGCSALTVDDGALRQPLPSVQELAIARFFHDFILDGSASSGHSRPNAGYLARIPGMYRRCEAESSFALALSAAANANFWRRHMSPQAKSNSLKDCSKALQQLRTDLEHGSSLHEIADLLTASSLLAIYQLIATRDVSQRTSWTAHVNGAVALLGSEERDNTELYSLSGVLQPIVSQMLMDCLVMGRHPKHPLDRCTSVMELWSPSAMLFTFMYRTAELCATGLDGYSADAFDPTQQTRPVDIFLEKCQALDEEMSSWMDSRSDLEPVVILPNTKQNVPAPLWSLFAGTGAPRNLHLCPDMDQTHQWHLYRACRLTVLRAMMSAIRTGMALAATDAIMSSYELRRDLVHSRTAVLVDDLLSAVFSSLVVPVPGKAKPESMTDLEGFEPSRSSGRCTPQAPV
ncbi:hypothetical protein M409DRAFT_53118 [Zasmidium cellare ATCC 36951]|uniref:Zn(2)-C6 fungal-type domain-containing protein n=1 Tax=Zasmidium cellare ATCC 36951 TaxID=1080233 RepID=A0A6A6CRM7_ZASCE|nr:uncharacterized protein M409DRAFT_53118 [Zasmidium cellare ATCC 36951]KAF2168439.1 hypothetical protein M409DRAFT_53118 [Zasmidium cellare ATCC 36951]